MKKFDNISDFENSLKENLNNHSTPAPTDVWNSISSVTGQGASGLSQTFSFFQSATNLLKVALFTGGIAAIGIVVYLENKVPATDSTTVSTENTILKEQDQLLADSVHFAPEILPEQNKNSPKTSPENLSEKIVGSNTSGQPSPNETDLPSLDTYESETDLLIEQDDLTTEENSNANDSETLDFNISNLNPCKGELITLSSNQMVHWDIDNKIISEASSTFNFLCTTAGKHTFSITYKGKVETKTINVLDHSIAIQKTKKSPFEYTLSVSPKEQNVDWYVNGISYEKNTNQINLELSQVGIHKIVANPTTKQCTNQEEIIIEIDPIGSIQIYDFFTPNGDGKNDNYIVDISEYERFTIQIFNLKGALVFATTDPNIHWNGMVNNQGPICKGGEYVAKITYKLKGENPSLKSTRITLTRD